MIDDSTLSTTWWIAQYEYKSRCRGEWGYKLHWQHGTVPSKMCTTPCRHTLIQTAMLVSCKLEKVWMTYMQRRGLHWLTVLLVFFCNSTQVLTTTVNWVTSRAFYFTSFLIYSRLSNHKIKQQTLESQNTPILYYIYIKYVYNIYMVTVNNYMFRPLRGLHQVVHPIKRVGGAVQLPTLFIVCTAWWWSVRGRNM